MERIEAERAGRESLVGAEDVRGRRLTMNLFSSADAWACRGCTFMNDASSTLCRMCEGSRHSSGILLLVLLFIFLLVIMLCLFFIYFYFISIYLLGYGGGLGEEREC